MDSRFFQFYDSIDSKALAGRFTSAGLRSKTPADAPGSFDSLKPLKEAGPRDLSFFHNAKYINDLELSAAGAILVPIEIAEKVGERDNFWVVSDVHRALALAGQAFLVPPTHKPGIHPTAVIDPSAQVPASVEIGPYVVIGAGVEIGENSRLCAHVSLADGVQLGRGCHIDPGVVISHALIGDRVHIKPGAAIGQRGFGWAVSPQGHVAKPQVGRVLIGDDVEIGANCAIDRGSVEDTEIGDGTVIDNLCHISHNCKIGRFCALAATIAFAGSTVLGDFVRMGGGVAAKGHVHIADGTVAQAWTFIGRNTKPGEVLVGNPARSSAGYQRLLRNWSRIARGAKGES